jgi:mannose-P-dolichol utilization defect protein 1
LERLLQCCTCDLCGLGPVFEFLFAGVGTAWWAIAAIVLMKKSWAANDAGVPEVRCHAFSRTFLL